MTDRHEQFDLLTPDVVIGAVEESFSLALNGVITPYTSYVNRVYGLQGESGDHYVAKFYRPGRWTEDAILEEHQFCWDCVDADLPVVPPVRDADGATLGGVVVEGQGGQDSEYLFAVYPRRAGRTFDTNRDEDWLRIGSMLGRMHAVGATRSSVERLHCHPDASTGDFVQELHESGTVHPDAADDFFGAIEEGLSMIRPLFASLPVQRVHGDCHRGNILDRGEEGLLLIDFDDMMVGPPVQDIWLLLPDHASESGREIELLLEGYETFTSFDRRTLRLIEPLRLMRIVYFLAWSARQRHDHQFRTQFPDWGSEAFWIKEVEDIRAQVQAIAADLSRYQ